MPFYFFQGNGDCSACSAQTGYFTIMPNRPHPNCECEIELVQEKACDGEWWAQGLGPERDRGDGFREQDYEIHITQPDGSVDNEIITIAWPDGVNLEVMYELMDLALELAAENASDECPEFNCC